MPTFVALDFETSHHQRDSACALGLVRVERGEIVHRERRLIRPPAGRPWMFTSIHGLRPGDVARAPTFGQAWEEIRPLLAGARFLAAHNASFDRSVLRACCSRAGLEMPALPFQCSMQLARRAWGLYPTRLPDVCAHLGLELDHHDALSDAEACARIVIAALDG
jgi:DNA polymerase-3 subunit epsilon